MIIDSITGKRIHTKETIEKIKTTLKGRVLRKSPYKHSPEIREKLRLSHSTPEYKEKFRKARLGHKVSDEARLKMSLARKGKPNYKKRGQKSKPETLIKLSLAAKKRWEDGKFNNRKADRLYTSIAERKLILAVTEKLYMVEHIYNNSTMYGRPDVFLSKSKIVIFVDGCYYHCCQIHCPTATTKFPNRIEFDKKVTKILTKNGYLVIRIWQHDLEKDEKKFNYWINYIVNICNSKLVR
jgi:DNA mismatch endonuclease (patch repair protein)